MNDWQPIETAPRDGTRVLLRFKDSFAESRPDLGCWYGLPFVGSNRGDLMHWSFAAPVGMGGFPDDWLAGWMPLPAAPRDGVAP